MLFFRTYMLVDCIPYQNISFLSPLISDFISHKENIKEFLNFESKIENFEQQIFQKSKEFTQEKRNLLVQQLQFQNQVIQLSDLSKKNIELLSNQKTFTITTGHQLNLFTGPIYYLYKIANTINLSKQLKEKYPDYNFVPIFWMASEDHDFEEINHFYTQNQKFVFDKKTSGIVGEILTDDIKKIYEVFEKEFHFGANHHYLVDLFKKAYLEHKTLVEASRYLTNELFGKFGLVIIDGNDATLKREFIPVIEKELSEQISFKEVNKTIEKLKPYSIQVNPREINLFYIDQNIRERIIFKDEKFIINNLDLSFTKEEFSYLINKSPEKISPNVILRPVYQESILPNLAYIGGAGEIAYWLELKSTFEAFGITFPIIMLRNSAIFIDEKLQNKLIKNNTKMEELFLNNEDLMKLKVSQYSHQKFDFSQQKKFLEEQFLQLEKIAASTDKSFIGAVKAQQKKQQKGLENLEKRLFKAEKRVFNEQIEKALNLKESIFPNGTFQERRINFSEVYHETLIENLVQELDIFRNEILIFNRD